MRIGVQAQLLVFVADFLPPDCRERKEETLLRSEAVDFLIALFRMFIERLLERGVSKFYSAYVGDVFTLGQRAVHTQSRQRLVFVVLRHDRFRSFLEFLRRLRRPP